MRMAAILLIIGIYISGCTLLQDVFPTAVSQAQLPSQNNTTAQQPPEPQILPLDNATQKQGDGGDFWENGINETNGSAAINESLQNNESINAQNNESMQNGSVAINAGAQNGSIAINESIAQNNSLLANNSAGEINASTNMSLEGKNIGIIFVNAGQGDAVIIRANGYTILVDTGTAQSANEIASMLRAAGAKEVDTLIISTWATGKIGGMQEILRRFAVHEAWTSREVPAAKVYEDAQEQLSLHEIYTIYPNAGDEILRGGLKIEVLNPQDNEYENYAQANAIVLKVSYGEFCILLPSDLEQEMEPVVVSRLERGCPVYMWRNHGEGRESASQLYLRASPKDVIISVGANTEGLPSPTTLERINISGAKLWRTDKVGGIYVNASKSGEYNIMPASISAIAEWN